MIRYLTGIKPTGLPHLGHHLLFKNLLKIIKPEDELILYIADYHSLSSLVSMHGVGWKEYSREATENIIKFCISLGISEKQIIIQSSIPKMLELYFILSSLITFSEIKRMHLFKTVPGLVVNELTYPVLMVADCIIFQPDVIFVGHDQNQHLNLYRRFCKKHKLPYGTTQNTDTVLINEKKMSKSKGNGISIFDSENNITKKINSIVTLSTSQVTIEHIDNNITHLLNIFEDYSDIHQRYMLGTNFHMEKQRLIRYCMEHRQRVHNIEIVYDQFTSNLRDLQIDERYMDNLINYFNESK